ncbi:C-type lectin domain family 19 member A-like [Nerophis lumbriciformis]|uniref:C-type lectin domain family 19 member A-like n=1 Tax=Nerophis lumbriciformis TaxID=546530 RepID=UPI002AE09F9C|nr:snaclec coagulation factor IX-binding protein subunit A-like [Nerophis lumbriciformis]
MTSALRVVFLLCGISGLLAVAQSVIHKKECGCPKEWIQFQSYCYKHIELQKTFADAEETCQLFHGNLVSIEGPVENAVVLQLIRDYNDGFVIDTWIGGHDTLLDGTYWWTDGAPFVFSDFDMANTGACVEIDDDERWNGDDCTDLNPFVCERDVCI